MKLTLLIAATAIALSAPAVPHAHAEYVLHAPGQWVDTRHHLALGGLADDNEHVARLGYAMIACHAKTGTSVGEQPTRGYDACMRTEGFVFAPESPAQLTERNKAQQDAQNRAQRIAVGQALSGMADDLNRELNRPRPQPQSCNGSISGGGYVDMTCN